MPQKNIINRIHETMNDFFDRTKTRPYFIYIGEKEILELQLSEGLFCPPEHVKNITKEKLFEMEPVFVKRNQFLKVG